MFAILPESSSDLKKEKPRCAIFGQCGGCQFQHIPYAEELRLKEQALKKLFVESLHSDTAVFEPIVSSPQSYHYRHRIDLRLVRTKKFGVLVGFSAGTNSYVIETSSCPIAMASVSDFIPELKKQAILKLTAKHRNANLVVKTGDDGRVFWGGIGRRSLSMKEEDYLWTVVNGQKIFYSLDTFFQANLSILPVLIEYLRQLTIWTPEADFYDLYGGVGLFGLCLYDLVKQVVLIEENIYAVKLAQYNVHYHALKNFEILSGQVEGHLAALERDEGRPAVMMVDPPRQGLSGSVVETLARLNKLKYLLYLSCSPESLVRDLNVLTADKNWQIAKVVPFDFFPRTQHLETLVLLKHK